MSETEEMDKEDSGGEDKGLDLSASLRKMKPPNKKKFEGEVDQLMEQIRIKESEMKSLAVCPEHKVQADLRKIRAEKDATIEMRKKVDADLKALNQEISQRMGQLSHLQSGLPYKNEERINSTISRLEMQLKTQNFKLSEEKKIVSEIDSLKRSKKVLSQYLTEKKVMDEMRDRQRRMREQRENYFKLTPHLKSREDELRRQNLISKSKAAALKKEIDLLYEEKRKVCSDFKKYEKDYYSLRDEVRKKQRRESIRKREEEKKAMMMAITREIAEYDAQKQPYKDERQLCNTLITYLQRFVTSSMDTNDTTPQQEPPSPRQRPAATLSPCNSVDDQLGASVDGMYVLLRKSEEDLFSGINRKTRKNSKRKKLPLNKPVTHTPQIFAQFSSLMFNAPSTMAEVHTSIEQLTARKKYYESFRRQADEHQMLSASLSACSLPRHSALLPRSSSCDGDLPPRTDGIIPPDQTEAVSAVVSSAPLEVQRQTSKTESQGSGSESQTCNSIVDFLSEGSKSCDLFISSSPTCEDDNSSPECDRRDTDTSSFRHDADASSSRGDTDTSSFRRDADTSSLCQASDENQRNTDTSASCQASDENHINVALFKNESFTELSDISQIDSASQNAECSIGDKSLNNEISMTQTLPSFTDTASCCLCPQDTADRQLQSNQIHTDLLERKFDQPTPIKWPEKCDLVVLSSEPGTKLLCDLQGQENCVSETVLALPEIHILLHNDEIEEL